MEPQIRYVRSNDGTRIAVYMIGESRERPPFIYMPVVAGLGGSSNWQSPEIQSGLARISERRPVLWFDPRGTGLSDRDSANVSLDTWIADLDAVVRHASESLVDLYVPTFSGPIGIAYAARNPDRVRRLILWSSIVAGGDFRTPPIWRLTAPIAELDFDFFVRVRFLQTYGWTETGRRMAEASKGATTREVMNAGWAAVRASDASRELADVRCPTMVVHHADNEWIPLETARRIAATVPNARLVTLNRIPSEWPVSFSEAPEESARIILDFLDEDAPIGAMAAVPEGTAVIVFADIVDSTAHTERVGDTAFRSQSREVDGHLRAIIREHGGAIVEGKVMGDGVMAVFQSTARAIECAIAGHDATLGSELQLRIGLHAGDVIRETDNVYGGAVNIASRICALAHPGEVLVSATVRELARTSAGVAFEDRGEQALQGVGDAVRVYAVRKDAQ